MKSVTILGSTGSIGTQTLETAEHLGMKVLAITAHSNAKLLQEQKEKYKPEVAVLASQPGGDEAVCRIARESGADILVTAIAGTAGLEPTLSALKTGKRVALANKEPLVCAGEQVMSAAKEHGTEIIPVDSEHSAIYQCLKAKGSKDNTVCKIILTASGGPFRDMSAAQLKNVTPEQALRHPNWKMGKKVTVDSATMMNKGLEFIEAMHLFSVKPEQIEVVIHPESIVHSMVMFEDGSTVAQLSHPDMRMPIQYALTYPERVPGLTKPLDITQIGSLTFEKPDFEKYPCLELAIRAAGKGQSACAALNKANEEAVEMFLKGDIGFTEIAKMVEKAVS